MKTATSMHPRRLMLITALTLNPLIVSLPTALGQTYQQSGYSYPQSPCDALPCGTQEPRAHNATLPGPTCAKCPCPDCQPGAPRKADGPAEPRSAPPPPPEMRETGFYQAGPRTGALEGPSSSLGLRGAALTLPRIRIELPTIELPSCFRSSQTARMRVNESEAPWTSTGYERVAVSGYDQARSAPAQARGADEPKASRSADDDEADALKREYEKKIEELNRKISECEQLRKSIESSLRCQPPLPQPQQDYAPPAPACQAASNAACTCPVCRSHPHATYPSGTQLRIIPNTPTGSPTHPRPTHPLVSGQQQPLKETNDRGFEMLETPSSRPPSFDSGDLPPPKPIPTPGPAPVAPSANSPYWRADQTTKQASHIQPVIAPVQHTAPAVPHAAMRPQRLPAL